MAKVFLLTTGDGSDGNEWGLVSIHSTLALAIEAMNEYAKPVKDIWDKEYTRDCQVEEWEVDEKISPPTPLEMCECGHEKSVHVDHWERLSWCFHADSTNMFDCNCEKYTPIPAPLRSEKWGENDLSWRCKNGHEVLEREVTCFCLAQRDEPGTVELTKPTLA